MIETVKNLGEKVIYIVLQLDHVGLICERGNGLVKKACALFSVKREQELRKKARVHHESGSYLWGKIYITYVLLLLDLFHVVILLHILFPASEKH